MASKHEMVYILSEDYWGFDPATRDDALNFYTNVWTLPKSQYDSMTDEDDRRKLYRCALFYVVDKTDNHGFTPLAIQSQGNTVMVAATAAGGGITKRKYDSGADSEYETGSIIMRQADSKATTFEELQDMSTSTPGKFKIEEFIFDNETAIKSKVEELQEELGQINAAESYASESAPADVALDVSQPLAANPTTAAIAGADLITDVQDTSLDLFAEETMNLPNSNLPGLPVVANDFGESSALTSGHSVPQWYGADGELSAADKMAIKRKRMMESKMRGINRRNARKDKMEQMSAEELEGSMNRLSKEEQIAFLKQIIEDNKGLPPYLWMGGFGLNGKVVSAEVYLKHLQEMGAEEVNPIQFEQVGGQDALGVGLPVIANDFGQDSAGGSGHGVPQSYGAEGDMTQLMTSNALGQAGTNYDHEIHYRADELSAEDFPGLHAAEQTMSLSPALPGLPVVPNDYGEDSSLSGHGVPEYYGAEGGRKYGKRQRFDHIKGNSRYLARNAKGQWISNVGVSGSIKQDLRSNAKSQQPVGFRGLGDANVRRAEAAPSVIDAAEPLEYIPYEFADEMDVGEYISSDDFMVLLAETVDGMALRYKPPMYRSPLAMAGAGAILAVVGMKLLKK